jgi:uncharacterized phage protein (TIGR02216 family)
MSGPQPIPVRPELVEGLHFFAERGKKDGASTGSARTVFGESASRLAGFAGAFLHWAPDAFWRATPAELACVVRVLAGEDTVPPDAATIRQLMEAFPDG